MHSARTSLPRSRCAEVVFDGFLSSGCQVVVIGMMTSQELVWEYASRHPEVDAIHDTPSEPDIF